MTRRWNEQLDTNAGETCTLDCETIRANEWHIDEIGPTDAKRITHVEHEAILKRTGEIIRMQRKHTGVSQEELGECTGIHRAYIGGIERGERNPSLRAIISIASALGIPVSYLFPTNDIVDLTTRGNRGRRK